MTELDTLDDNWDDNTYTSLDGRWSIVRGETILGNGQRTYLYLPYIRDHNGDYIWTDDKADSATEAYERFILPKLKEENTMEKLFEREIELVDSEFGDEGRFMIRSCNPFPEDGIFNEEVQARIRDFLDGDELEDAEATLVQTFVDTYGKTPQGFIAYICCKQGWSWEDVTSVPYTFGI